MEKTTFDVKGGFHELSGFYDSDELRFFLDSSKLMVKELDLAGVRDILDIATGTGHTALELAKAMPLSRITGIDISSSMLERARAKSCDVPNVAFKQHDLRALAQLDGKFDLVTFSFGTYFVKDKLEFFHDVSERLHEFGKIVLLAFAEGSFVPHGMVFMADLKEMGIIKEFPESFSIQNRKWIDDLKSAGFRDIRLVEKKLKYTINRPAEWWKIICGTAFRSFLTELSPQDLDLFKDHHLKKVAGMIQEGINSFTVNILIVIGTNESSGKFQDVRIDSR